MCIRHNFTLGTWVLRTEERAREVAGLYHVETSSDIHTALSLPHEIAFLCGTSIIRHFLDERYSNCTIQASSQTSWITRTAGRESIDTEGIRVQTNRITATLEFEDGKIGYFDFDNIQYHSSIRSSHFSLYGGRGEIAGDNVRFLNEEIEGICQRLERVEDGNKNINPLSLRALSFGDSYVFRNPYWPLPFNDDESSLALCMEAASQGQGYCFAEALQGSYLVQCIQRSCKEKMLAETKKQIWAEDIED